MVNNRSSVKTLAEQVRWQLLWLGIVLLLACLLILFVFAWRATELNINILMQLEAQSLIRQVVNTPYFSLPQGETLSAYRQWSEIPETLRQHFDSSLVEIGKVIEAKVFSIEGEVEYLYLLHHVDGSEELFLLSRHHVAEIEAVYLAFFKSALNQALWLTFIIFIVLFFLVRWLIRRTTNPLAMLSQWAVRLGKNPEQALRVNFPIEELNQIATQLHEGVDRIKEFNQREQEFLKYASHELRTPLATIQASLDTLNFQADDSNQQVIVQRALRASANMRQLSTTLLWLARESTLSIDKTWLDARISCDQIVKDHNYLIHHRDIMVRTQVTVEALLIERDLFFIVITNLVRNAFQHSASGIIDIELSEIGLRITNPIKPTTKEEEASTQGFRLGLELVQRICSKLGWLFEFNRGKHVVVVTVIW